MNNYSDSHILVIAESTVDSNLLTTLLSPLSKNIAAFFSYTKALEFLFYLKETNTFPDLIFFSLPSRKDHNFAVALKIFVCAQENGKSAGIFVVGDDTLPAELLTLKANDHSLISRPITPQKLANVLTPLHFSLAKTNCWEYMKCGRNPGGENAAALGVCPAAIDPTTGGVHSGICGGRTCWAISGTICCKAKKGDFVCKIEDCQNCDFYQLVKLEEGPVYESIDSILNRIKRKKA